MKLSNPMMTLSRGIALYFMDRYILPESIHENYLKWVKDAPPTTAPASSNDEIDIDATDMDVSAMIEEYYSVTACNPVNDDSVNGKGTIDVISMAADTFSNRDFTFPLSSASTYNFECQEFVGVYAINLPLGYLREAPIKNKIPTLTHPRQFSTNVTKASQEKIIAYLCSLSTPLNNTDEGREKLIQLKHFISMWLNQKKYDSIVEKLYAYELLPEHITILLKIKTDYADDGGSSASKKTKDLFSIKVQRNIEELFEEYNEKMYHMYKLPYIQVRHESRRTIDHAY
jgi:hypothetical protein